MDIQSAPIVVARSSDGYRISFIGPIHTNISWIERELEKVVKASPKLVELDLTGSAHISSLGLGMLVGFHNQITKLGGTTRIVAIKKRTLGILKTAFLDRLLKVPPEAVVDAEA